MIRLPTDMSGSDVAQWLNSGVFYARPRGRTPDYAFFLGMDGRRVQAQMFDGDTVLLTPGSCYAVWPELGSFNQRSHKYAFHMSRLARRQYRRTINPRCVRTVVPFSYRLTRSTGFSVDWLGGFNNVIKEVIRREYPSNWDELDRWIEDEGWHSVALNPRLIVAGSPSVDKRMLYLDGRLAATVIGGSLLPTVPGRAFATVVKMAGGRFHV